MTASEAYQKIQRGDLDKPISTIFFKVRGTEEFLKIPRYNLETMLRNYMVQPHGFLHFHQQNGSGQT